MVTGDCWDVSFHGSDDRGVSHPSVPESKCLVPVQSDHTESLRFRDWRVGKLRQRGKGPRLGPKTSVKGGELPWGSNCTEEKEKKRRGQGRRRRISVVIVGVQTRTRTMSRRFSHEVRFSSTQTPALFTSSGGSYPSLVQTLRVTNRTLSMRVLSVPIPQAYQNFTRGV